MLLPEISRIRKILVRVPNWIGDAVMATPALSVIRASFPDARITLAANPVVAELFSHHPSCDEIAVFDKKGAHRGFLGSFRFSRELRSGGFDLAILLQNAMEAAILAAIAGIRLRAGYRSDGRGILLTHGIPLRKTDLRLHHTDYYLGMLERLGLPIRHDGLVLHCTEEETAWARRQLGEGNWAAVNPGAAYGSAKRWFPERFAAVADAIRSEFGFRILLIGGPGEKEIGRQIESLMPARPFNMIGKTSVRQMMALLSLCRLMVTNDSGPMHVAAALRVPIAALFGPTDHATTSPLSAACRIIRKDTACAPCLKRVCPTDHRCMTAIAAEDVIAAVRSLVGDSLPKGSP
ncbi:MAG: lipopolysaccharide heptosyltransferase II [Syntrophobacteraceae bacterium]|nr:lipopolysaccharide heptosyltransferase II [Desulfobacteraceae bacterium]